MNSIKGYVVKGKGADGCDVWATDKWGTVNVWPRRAEATEYQSLAAAVIAWSHMAPWPYEARIYAVTAAGETPLPTYEESLAEIERAAFDLARFKAEVEHMRTVGTERLAYLERLLRAGDAALEAAGVENDGTDIAVRIGRLAPSAVVYSPASHAGLVLDALEDSGVDLGDARDQHLAVVMSTLRRHAVHAPSHITHVEAEGVLREIREQAEKVDAIALDRHQRGIEAAASRSRGRAEGLREAAGIVGRRHAAEAEGAQETADAEERAAVTLVGPERAAGFLREMRSLGEGRGFPALDRLRAAVAALDGVDIDERFAALRAAWAEYEKDAIGEDAPSAEDMWADHRGGCGVVRADERRGFVAGVEAERARMVRSDERGRRG